MRGKNCLTVLLFFLKCHLASKGFLADANHLDEFCRDNGFIAWFETSAEENIGIDEAARCLVEMVHINYFLVLLLVSICAHVDDHE